MLIITNMGVTLLQDGNIHSIPTVNNNLLFFPYLYIFCSAVHSGTYGFSSRNCVKTNLVAVMVPGGPNLCVWGGGGKLG